ncbi:thiamine-binding protein [Bacillus tianshenii]|nr:thiamine-binding protein [Bacillus tianshenii]
MTAGIQVLPNGKDMDTDGLIPKVVEVVKNSGLKYEVGPMETVVEGNVKEILNLVEEAQQVGVDSGAKEVITNVKLHYKPEGVTINNKLKDV